MGFSDFVVYFFVGVGILYYIYQAKTGEGKAGAQWHGRSRCDYCGKGLRSLKGVDAYADVCHHCGRTQPWVKGHPGSD